ncbi:MAG: helix-hairpin-helix domain-containing protein [Clostridia bacterium]|nr:helix-hairpin-helix domain-containing protein [Clostridia bacterium]
MNRRSLIVAGAVLLLILIAAGSRAFRGKTALRPNGWREEAIAPDGAIDINLADADLLATLPGIGETLAERIVGLRDGNGPFQAPEDLLSVYGIGEGKLDGFLPRITVSGGE